MKHEIRTITIAMFLALCTTTYANLIANGSFEEPIIANNTYDQLHSVPGWSTDPGERIELWSGDFGGIPASAGNQSLEINANSANQTVRQTVSLTAGVPTIFSFDYTGRFADDNTFSIALTDGASLFSTLNPPKYSNSWQGFSMAFVPTNSSVTIAFNGMPSSGIAGGAHIDNAFMVQNVPESTNSIYSLGLSISLLLWVRRKIVR